MGATPASPASPGENQATKRGGGRHQRPPPRGASEMDVVSLPFGKRKGEPLAAVPTSYLQWSLTVKLSTRLRSAAAAAVQARGVAVPAPPARAGCWAGPCPRCACPEVDYRWHEFRNGTRQVRASCRRCGGSLGHAPLTEPYTTEADRAASPTPTLDALVLAEAED